jgi:hypothetical protein
MRKKTKGLLERSQEKVSEGRREEFGGLMEIL